jgi:hypothetical protein
LKKFALGNLYADFIGKPYEGQRALDGVEAMEELFSHRSLAGLLSSMPSQTAEEQLQKWAELKRKRAIKAELNDRLGHKKEIKKHQIDRLAELDLSYPRLCDIRTKFTDDEEFQKELLKRKVKSKKLRDTLTDTLSKGE